MHVLEETAVADGVSVDDMDLAGWQAEFDAMFALVAGGSGGWSRG